MKDNKMKPKYQYMKQPLYRLDWEFIDGRLTITASEIGKRNYHTDVKATYPVTMYAPLSYPKIFWEDLGPAGFLTFDFHTKKLSDLIVEVEKEIGGATSDFYVNAYKIGRCNGNRKGHYFEIQVEFFQIDINKQKDYKKIKELRRNELKEKLNECLDILIDSNY